MLFFFQPAQCLPFFPQSSGSFEFQRITGGLHLCFQFPGQLTVPTFEKTNNIINHLAVFLLRNFAGTRSQTSSNIVIEARTFFADIARQMTVAGSQRIYALQGIKCPADIATQPWTKITGTLPDIIFNMKRFFYFRKSVLKADSDIRILFIVTQKNIIMRFMLFY